jgi:hypothetical protein
MGWRAIGMAPYQGLCVLSLTLHERPLELIRHSIPGPWVLSKDYRQLLHCMGEYLNVHLQLLYLSISVSLSFSLVTRAEVT